MCGSYAEIFLALLILVLPFVYESCQSFRYYLKFFAYYVIVSANAIFMIPLFALRYKNVRNLVTTSHICRFVSPLIGLKWILRGKEHLEQERACVIVCNHQSSLDILGMFDIWHVMDKCTAIAKKEIFWVWPFGLAAWLCGLVFIDRVNPEKAKQTMNEAGEHIKLTKTKLWVFPEGKRHNTGEIHHFKKGAFVLAVKAQLPILPIVFSRYYFLNEQKHIFNSGQIIVTTLPAIPTEGLALSDVEDLMERTHKVMADAFRESSKEVLHQCV